MFLSDPDRRIRNPELRILTDPFQRANYMNSGIRPDPAPDPT
jgi:hypothetical protein